MRAGGNGNIPIRGQSAATIPACGLRSLLLNDVRHITPRHPRARSLENRVSRLLRYCQLSPATTQVGSRPQTRLKVSARCRNQLGGSDGTAAAELEEVGEGFMSQRSQERKSTGVPGSFRRRRRVLARLRRAAARNPRSRLARAEVRTGFRPAAVTPAGPSARRPKLGQVLRIEPIDVALGQHETVGEQRAESRVCAVKSVRG